MTVQNFEAMQFLSVASIFRNEASVLDEWIRHYMSRGVDHIHLIDDRSSDDFHTVLRPYLESGFVTLHECREDDSPGRQDRCYNHILAPLRREIGWLLLVDVDEFVWDCGGFSLRRFAEDLSASGESYVRIYMDDFGDAGHEAQPPSVVRGFTRRARRPSDSCAVTKFKHLVRMDVAARLGFHTTRVVGAPVMERVDLSQARLRLNHYKLQSRDRWMRIVVPRGSANGTEVYHHRHSVEFFDRRRDGMNAVEDLGLITQNDAYGIP